MISPLHGCEPGRSPGGKQSMAVRKASAVWEGSLREGKGTMKLGSGAFEGAY